MKKLFIIFISIFIFSLSSCTKSKNSTSYSYTSTEESTEATPNPDQGFYSPIYIRFANHPNIKTQINSMQIYHLRIDISDYSASYNNTGDLTFSDDDLDYLASLLDTFYEREKNVIIRFAYDRYFGGNSNKEASLDTMLKHIKQVSSVLNKYTSTITAIEVGMVGPWGEMHTSKCANSATINALIDEFLTDTSNISILVRTPKMIYDYLSISINDIETYKINEGDKAYRLSIFNDGYLGSSSDLGTYTNRDKETAWLSQQTAHNPYGGEVASPSSELHDIKNCIPEMNLLNLSYLNIAWNNNVIAKWKKTYYMQNDNFYNTLAFDYINAHLGYRFLLEYTNIVKCDDKIDINLNISNLGFGNLCKEKYLYIYLIDESNEVHEYNLNYKTKDISTLERCISTSLTSPLDNLSLIFL